MTPSPRELAEKMKHEEISTRLAGELLAVFNGSADHGQINVATFLIREALISFGQERFEAGLQEAAELAKEFSWVLPMYKTKKENELSDDVACEVSRQISVAINSLKGRK